MKKLISVMLCALFLMASVCISASAISLSSSRDELNAQMLDGEIRGMDYVYFSPVKGESDNVKYPVFVWLHGNSSGVEPRYQIKYRGFSNWASDEFQARFQNAGGCFLFAPRANSLGNTWSGVTVGELKKVIDIFIGGFGENVDYSRIYIGGFSVGGDMTWSMLLNYPDYFAAGVPCAAITPPSALSVSSLTDTSVWSFNCDIDYYAGAKTSNIRSVINKLSDVSNRREGIRLTSLSQAVLADGTKQGGYREEHYTWEAVTYDMHMSDGVTPYKYATTVDGTGATISFSNPEEGVISWLSMQTNEKSADDGDSGSGTSSGFAAFFQKIIDFFKNFFKALFGG